jgi:zinc protease
MIWYAMQVDIQHGVHVYTFGPGLSAVIKKKSNIPLVTIAVAARGGTHNETAATAGLTGLMGRTSIKGTHTLTAGQIADAAERMGGSISPSVSADLLNWEITVPARHFERALELLCDVAFNAAFREEEFEVERKHALADLQQTRDDMYRYPLRLCLQQAFRGHPYGNTIADVERSLASATAGAVAAWHGRQACNHPWAFVVGDVDPDAAAIAISELFPTRNGREQPAASRPQWCGGVSDVEPRDKTQTALAIAFPGPARNHADVHALQVLTNAVSGLGGRFFEELRSKRSLAYTVALMPIARWLGGAFVAYIATSPEREDEARRALLEQFERLVNEPLPFEDVQRSQRYTIGTWQIRSQTNSAQLSDLMHACLLGPGVSEIVEFEDRVRSVTPAAILDVAGRYFDPAVAVQGIVRGKEQPDAR